MRSLQSRILALSLGLLLAVLSVTLVTIHRATYRHTRSQVQDELSHGRRVFLDKLATRQRSIWEAADTLAKDDALRQAIFADPGDEESLFVALNNHRVRTGSDLALLVDLDGNVLVDSREASRRGDRFPFPAALQPDATPHQRPRVALLDGRLYQLVVVPYYVPVSAPEPALWLLLGQAVDDTFARSLADLTGLEISFLVAPATEARATVVASSLPTAARQALAGTANVVAPPHRPVLLAGEEYLHASAPLPAAGGVPLAALLLRSTAEAFLDFRALSGEVLWIALLSVLLAGLGAVVIARGITRPVRALERAARQMGRGDYDAPLPLEASGEIGGLARELGRMQQGIREREAAIHHLAYHDDLTGLPNRNRFRLDVDAAIDHARTGRARLAVAVVDVDRFKEVNDALGHHVGDRLLLQLAARLQTAAEERHLVVARLGGDEFGVLLPGLGIRETGDAATALRTILGAAFEADEVHVEVEASVGIALFPDHGTDAASLLKRAEVAMYVAKERKLGLTFYDSTQDRHSVQRLSLMGELRRAIDGDELTLCYQPKVELASGRVVGAEALVRWRHPRLGMVSPAEFVPIAEQTGAIRSLTRWVLARALAQAAEWERDGRELGVAVNISALDLHDRELPRRVAAELAATGLPAQRLVLEITESGVMAEPLTARRILEELVAMGVNIAVDDFGTGYSSLAQLKRLPVQELKVDRSFVMEMGRAPDMAAIVRSTIEMGHGLGLRVVAEGVETRETLEALRAMGCDVVQGYYLGEPMAAAALERRLDDSVAGAVRLTS